MKKFLLKLINQLKVEKTILRFLKIIYLLFFFTFSLCSALSPNSRACKLFHYISAGEIIFIFSTSDVWQKLLTVVRRRVKVLWNLMWPETCDKKVQRKAPIKHDPDTICVVQHGGFT